MDENFNPNTDDIPPEFIDPEPDAEKFDPKYGLETSTATLRNLWSEWLCNKGSGRFANPSFFGRKIGGVAAPAADAVAALEAALRATGYEPTSRWAFNCRKIGGSDKFSLHAYGIAIDIDPGENPFSEGDRYSGRLKRSHVEAVLAIKNRRGQSVWSWGGSWRRPDRMHFQIDRGPDNVDVDWSTVRGADPSKTAAVGDDETGIEVEEDEMVLKRGQHGAAVTHFQKRLMAWNGEALPEHGADGDYGAETEVWIRKYQEAAALEVTGNIDGVTAALLQGDIV